MRCITVAEKEHISSGESICPQLSHCARYCDEKMTVRGWDAMFDGEESIQAKFG